MPVLSVKATRNNTLTEHPQETKQTTHTKDVTSSVTFIEMNLNTCKRSFCARAPLTAVTSAVHHRYNSHVQHVEWDHVF
jgi:hypothetical protein